VVAQLRARGLLLLCAANVHVRHFQAHPSDLVFWRG
jgi:hypothetical protein